MITTMGLSDNPYAWDVQSVVTMDDLFVLCPNYIKLEEMATESVLKAFCKALKIKLVKERLPLRDLNDA